MMPYPDHETYELLYSRYFSSRAPHDLLANAGNIRDKRVLDLCAGNCRAGAAAIDLGARIVDAVDQQREMLPVQPPIGVRTHHMDAWSAVCFFRTQRYEAGPDWDAFGAVVCQQAINYWLKHSPSVIQILVTLMEPGAAFVFNTFNRKPSTKPTVKEYEFAGRQYTEMSWLDYDDCVHHVQALEGHEPHVTCFDWISPQEFRKFLTPYFNVTERRDGNTSIYTCIKESHGTSM